LVVVDEDTKTVGAAAEIAVIVAEEGFEHLHAPDQEGDRPRWPRTRQTTVRRLVCTPSQKYHDSHRGDTVTMYRRSERHA
jgi:pyruvate/2-oxoglutarate/acetoin dehydrogenase E1 component